MALLRLYPEDMADVADAITDKAARYQTVANATTGERHALYARRAERLERVARNIRRFLPEAQENCKHLQVSHGFCRFCGKGVKDVVERGSGLGPGR
jgi:hypothetical protein